MATLTVYPISRAGVDSAASSVAAAGGGDSFPNTGAEFVLVRNGGGGSITVTLDVQATVDGQAVTDKTVTVAAGVTKAIGPFLQWAYGSTVGLTYSGVTSVTVGVFRLTPEKA